MGKQADLLWVAIVGAVLVAAATPRPLPQPYPGLDPHPPNQPRPLIAVPVGCDNLLSRGCAVTSSDRNPSIGELSYVTDGDKEQDPGSYVELGAGLQWVQIDLGEEKEVHAICLWHFFEAYRIYYDVVVQISSGPDFTDGVVTVFNNDMDNSAKLGAGTDKEYIESNYGRPFAVGAVKGRYVRCYSNGNSANKMNHYLEVEVFGRPLPKKEPVKVDKPIDLF